MNKYGDKSLSFFEISFDVFEQLINNGVFGWRYWEILDFEDIKAESLFLDFAITDKNKEEYQAVKWCKDN
jgi:predicted negative regulator of RcsB-dependent stress response